MKVVVAPDSFKGSLSAAAAADAMAVGVRAACPEAEVVLTPVSDGGEGTAETLVQATGGRLEIREVSGPLGELVRARFAVLGDGSTAVIEMAEAAGLTLVPEAKRDPRRATTRGVGALALAAIDAGCTTVIVALGGSATNDAGAGFAQALGARLLDSNGVELPAGGAALARLARIEPPPPRGVTWLGACDVDNPLCGPRGASHVYGPQKGADPQAVVELDAALARFAQVAARDLGRDVLTEPGAGAAGGFGAGLLAFVNGRLERGAERVLDALNFDRRLEGADLVITGEGRLDAQTLSGKAPAAVSRRAKAAGIPVIAICGDLQATEDQVRAAGFESAHGLTSGGLSVSDAVRDAADLLASTTRAVVARRWA